MTDEDETELSAPSNEFHKTRAYDFLKHLTTLSLISIGGILGLLQNESVAISDESVLISLGSIGLAGLTALMTNGTLVGTPLSGKPPGRFALNSKGLYYLQSAAVLLFMFGAGVFTGAFSIALT